MLARQCPYHIKTNQLICIANRLTGFYVMETLVVNGLIVFLLLPFHA